ncbi:MAG TPA: LexA family transcriptional regulator [Candidatus Xenobia bacterium]
MNSRLLGQRIRRLREAKGYSQGGLARQARIGVATLSRTENGRHKPTQETLEKLSGALGVSLSNLYSDTALDQEVETFGPGIPQDDRESHEVRQNVLQAIRDEVGKIVSEALYNVLGPPARRNTALQGEKPTSLLPLLGRIPAGPPAFQDQDFEAWIPIPDELVGKREGCFIVRARGNSMEPTIRDNDLLVCRAQNEAQNGQIVIAFSGGEGTVKRLRTKHGKRVLVADNPAYADQEYSASFRINARVISVMRRL